MALDHDGFNFYNHNHTPVTRLSQPEVQLAVRRLFGLQGEFHIRGERGGSDLSCVMTMDNFATRTLLQDQLDSIQYQSLKLTGDLVEVLPNGGLTRFADCTFLGAQPIGAPFLDGSGQWGWVQRILLQWRARGPNS